MKTKYALMSGLAMLLATAAVAQVEYDDMYFNSKDRAKLNASKEIILAKQYQEEDKTIAKTSPINPTDSYSGRNVNPEYTNRLKVNPNSSNNGSSYFVSGYQPANVNKNVASNNCNCGNGMYNPYYSSVGMNPYYGGFGMNPYSAYSSYGFTSPYSMFYSPWSRGMMGGSYYMPGWSSMLGFGYGGMMSGMYPMGSMGFGMGGWGNPYGSSMFGYGSSYYGMNSYYGYGSYYGNSVINSGADYNNTVYGKRSNRSSDTNNMIDRSRPESAYTRNGRTVASGRSRSDNSQSQYYDRGWKRDPSINSSRSMWSDNSGSTSGSRSAWSNSSSSGRQSSSSNDNWGGNTNSRSSFNSFGSGGSSFGGGSRSGGSFGGGGGSSSGGHSRGR